MMDTDRLQALWESNAEFSFGTSVALAMFFLGVSVFCYGLTWYLQMSSMVEYGYPKRSEKSMRKKFKQHTTVEKITLTKLRRFATRNGFMLQLCWMINIVNLLFSVISSVGIIAFIVTRGSGWSGVLALFLPVGSCLLFVAIRFIPDLIWLPSERRRYFRR